MKNTRDELMEEYARILIAHDDMDRPMTEEERKEVQKMYQWSGSGESKWDPGMQEEPESPTESVNLPGWPKKIKMQDGTERVFDSPGEWRKSLDKPSVEKEPEPEVVTVEEPELEEVEPEVEVVEPEYSAEEVLKMVKEDPEHVVMELKLQRKPEYKKFMQPMLRSLVDWMTESEVSPDKGTELYEETEYMLEELNKKIYEERELGHIEKSIGKTKSTLDKLEKMVELEEERNKKPVV